jgi:hypothetical protein
MNCPKCNRETRRYGLVRDKQRYRCANCNYTFTKKEYICKYCGCVYSDGQEFGRHVLKCRVKENNKIELTKLQKQLILGSMLGDMYMYYPTKGSKLPLVEVTHGIDQRAYTMWKYYNLNNLTRSEPKERKTFSKKDNKFYGRIRFCTMSLAPLIPMYELTHTNGKRYINEAWLDEMTDSVAIAVWYLDDGDISLHRDRNSRTVKISLGKMTDIEILTLRNWLRDYWGVITRTNKLPHQNVFRINKKEDVEHFISIVSPIIINEIPIMKYKIRENNRLINDN